jgi:hypothetical protein
MLNEDQIKEAFQKIKQDIINLQSETNFLKDSIIEDRNKMVEMADILLNLNSKLLSINKSIQNPPHPINNQFHSFPINNEYQSPHIDNQYQSHHIDNKSITTNHQPLTSSYNTPTTPYQSPTTNQPPQSTTHYNQISSMTNQNPISTTNNSTPSHNSTLPTNQNPPTTNNNHSPFITNNQSLSLSNHLPINSQDLYIPNNINNLNNSSMFNIPSSNPFPDLLRSSYNQDIILNNNQLDSSTHPSTHPAHNPTLRQINKTVPAHNPTDNLNIKPLNGHFLPISIGNEGVSTDRQTDRQTDRHIQFKPKISFKEDNISQQLSSHNPIKTASNILDSLDNIKKEIRQKFKRLTEQELLIFSTIYQLDEDVGYSDYKSLSNQLNLTESSIRDYIGRLIKKGIPVEKTKINNKSIQLNISKDLKKIASLPTILQLRDI